MANIPMPIVAVFDDEVEPSRFRNRLWMSRGVKNLFLCVSSHEPFSMAIWVIGFIHILRGDSGYGNRIIWEILSLRLQSLLVNISAVVILFADL